MVTAIKIIGTTVGGGTIGFVTGFLVGLRDGGDYNFAPAFYAPMGAIIGGAVGVVVGSIAFAR